MSKGPVRDPDLERRSRGLIEDQALSHLTVQSFCEARRLAVSSFHCWKRELRRRDRQESMGVGTGRR